VPGLVDFALVLAMGKSGTMMPRRSADTDSDLLTRLAAPTVESALSVTTRKLMSDQGRNLSARLSDMDNGRLYLNGN
jgi:hypothetical protein